MIATTDGHGNKVSYKYDLANERTRITYPNSEPATQEYDNAGRLKAVKDWLGHATTFKYNVDSKLTAIGYPSETKNEDTYAYDEADSIREVKMKKSAETLASVEYTRNKDAVVTKEKVKGLPGEELPAYTYDENVRLTKGAGVTYKYDSANNPTTIASNTYKYNVANELENKKLSTTIVATYTYNELGERIKTTPTSGSATTYSYNQADVLTGVIRPKEGETPAIEDSYTYNGDGLRAGQTISGVTTYLAWDVEEKIPLILNDGANNYIYGPGGLAIEQVNDTTSAVLYLHHDQQGSTRLLTGTTGTVSGSATYDAYGNITGTTGTAKASLGYDGQYTDADTGLIYLRAREYDPATAQFMSLDPRLAETRAPYEYAGDNPLSQGDPTGLMSTSEFTHRWLREFARINHTAARLHIDIGLFDDYALTGFYATLYNLSEEPRQAGYYNSWKSYYVLTVKHVSRALEPLAVGLETADSPQDLIKVLLKVARSVFGI